MRRQSQFDNTQYYYVLLLLDLLISVCGMSNAAGEQLASSFIFKQGLGETNAALTEEKKRELYGGDVVDLLFRERIPDNLHEIMSLEEFSLVSRRQKSAYFLIVSRA